ncbi:hypothetical protein [Vibrio sp. VB16]|uniref:hypothetical protein n=1 Tax=Vibrio sp. VB16 TaxID=2785746 RepID=UPI00189F9989|nr:hypothetical protein [Vibrio sp. VB16]UGA53482.1 hypothetical protein IUZ65_009195 [Vibrio sp. VB16]
MRKTLLALITGLVISGCDDDSSSSSNSISKASESDISSLVEATNYTPSATTLTDSGTMSTYSQTGIVRFDTTAQIPLYYVSSNSSSAPDSIVTAFSNLEDRLGDIFTDITVITADLSVYRDTNYSNENRGNGTFDASTFNSTYGVATGLVISEGTAYYSSEYSNDPQNMCANASSAPYYGGLSISIDPNTSLYASDTVLWLNMGNGQCDWDYKMVMHETAHNMGMFDHLDDYFGLWSDTAMNVLGTLYSNAGGTEYTNLTINYQ